MCMREVYIDSIFKFKGQRRGQAESHRGGYRCTSESDRAHGMLYTHSHIYIIVTIPSKLRLVKKWVLFDYGKGVKF